MSEPIRVLIADEMSKKAVEILSGAGFTVDVKTGMKPEELAAVIGQYHGVGIRSASKIKADTLANPGKLKIIGRAGVGVDNIDVKAATEKGILVINTPQGNAAAAAELAIGLMFALARKIPQAAREHAAGRLGEEEVHGRRDRRQDAGRGRPGQHRPPGGRARRRPEDERHRLRPVPAEAVARAA